jgi:hypothetical protein
MFILTTLISPFRQGFSLKNINNLYFFLNEDDVMIKKKENIIKGVEMYRLSVVNLKSRRNNETIYGRAMDDQDFLKRKIAQLQKEHDELDVEITSLINQHAHDQIYLQRLKKKKLALRDEIRKIESGLYPDIIA